MGFVLGFYSPVQKRWRNWDCRSQFFGMAVNTLNYAKYFDAPYELSLGTGFGTLLQLAFTGVGTMSMLNVCNA